MPRFVKKQVAELPFILNVPAGDYPVQLQAGRRILHVQHDLYAGTPGAFTYGAPIAIGAKDRLPGAFPPGSTHSLHHLRTAMQRTVSCETDLQPATEAEAIDEVATRMLRDKSTDLAGDALKAAAAIRFRALPIKVQAEIYSAKSRKLTGRNIFRDQPAEHFVDILNAFIRHYMVTVTDFFAEEVAYHQLASTTVGGIQEIILCDNQPVEVVTMVNKIPPIMRQPWYEHGPEKIAAFRFALQSGAPPRRRLLAHNPGSRSPRTRRLSFGHHRSLRRLGDGGRTPSRRRASRQRPQRE